LLSSAIPSSDLKIRKGFLFKSLIF
jgi:hypothetical protein